MQTNTQPTEGKDPQQTKDESSLDGATCSSSDRIASVFQIPADTVKDALTKSERPIEELAVELDDAKAEIAKLHAYIRKYRLALNRIASPKNWGVNEGYHVEIAKRALVIGGEPNVTLPDGASMFQTNDTTTQVGP